MASKKRQLTAQNIEPVVDQENTATQHPPLKIKDLNLTESKMVAFAWFCQQQKQVNTTGELETKFGELLAEYETNQPFDFVNLVNSLSVSKPKKRKVGKVIPVQSVEILADDISALNIST